MQGTVHLVANDGQTFKFTPDGGGFIEEVGEGRTVALSLGSDESGARRWAVRFVNDDNVIRFGMSDEAMNALVEMHAMLSIGDGE